MMKRYDLLRKLCLKHRVFYVKVLIAILNTGIPLSKLSNFCEVINQYTFILWYDLIPFVVADKMKQIKAEIMAKCIHYF